MPKQEWTTAVGEVGHGIVNVRGYPISEIIGRLSFAEAVFLTIRGELPAPEQRRLMDAALCSILEHGFYAPTTIAARVVASASPPSVIPGLAAGLLTIGSITVSPQHSAEIISAVRRAVADGQTAQAAAQQIASEMGRRGERMPGLGHPLHPEADPRAEALEAVARETGHWTEISGSYLAVRDAYLSRTQRNLPVNIDGMLGCVLSELGFRPAEMPGVAAISFLPGLIAHCTEELTAKPTLRIADGTYTGHPTRHLRSTPAKQRTEHPRTTP